MQILKYSIKDLEKLPSEEKKEYYRLLILDVVNKHPNGLSLSQIAEMTKADTRTVSKHLEYLTAIREIYKKEFGKRFTLYFPNVDISNPLFTKTFEIEGHYYTVKNVRNDFGEFVYIQEKDKNPYTNVFSTKGGIIIPKDKMQIFLDNIQAFMEVDV